MNVQKILITETQTSYLKDQIHAQFDIFYKIYNSKLEVEKFNWIKYLISSWILRLFPQHFIVISSFFPAFLARV